HPVGEIFQHKLETDVWAKGDAQIVMSAAGEIDFVANVKTQTDGTYMTFQSAARIENAGEIIRAQILNGTDSSSNSGRTIVEEEVIEAAFHSEKRMEAVMTKFEFGAEEAVEHTQIGASECDRWRNGGVVREAFGENLVKVVAHFGFEHDGFVGLPAKTRAHTGEIGFGLREAKIVGVDAGLNVIVLGERSRRLSNDA